MKGFVYDIEKDIGGQMFKRVFKRLGLLFTFVCLPVFAEEIAITTYYPSPYGVYQELQTNKMAVGDTNGNGRLDAGDQPPADGQLYAARSIIYNPQSVLPTVNVSEGELLYNSAKDALYLYNGSSWVEQGSNGGCYVSYSSGCAPGFTNQGSAGRWGFCRLIHAAPATAPVYFLPAGGSCYQPPGQPSYETRDYAEAYICCK